MDKLFHIWQDPVSFVSPMFLAFLRLLLRPAREECLVTLVVCTHKLFGLRLVFVGFVVKAQEGLPFTFLAQKPLLLVVSAHTALQFHDVLELYALGAILYN